MSWFDDVSAYIQNHLEEYATEILKAQSIEKAGKSIFINPCPFCDHNDCFGLTKGVNSAHCFSCDEKGTLIQIVQKKYGEIEGLELLAEWSKKKYTFSSYTPEQAEAKQKIAKFQQICHKAVDFYHQRLLKNEAIGFISEEVKPGTYQVKKRKHNQYGITKYKVGYSGGWRELKASLLENGYTEEDIQNAQSLIAFPDGYFLYPYYDKNGNLIRINAKLFVRYCRGKEKKSGGFEYNCDTKFIDLGEHLKKSHQNATGHTMNPNNLSRGDKEDAFFINPKDRKGKKKKYLILVEGENDVISTDEALQELPDSYKKHFAVAGIGGNILEGMFTSNFLREFEEVYECFDNDDAGDKYREQLDKEMPDVPLRRLMLPSDFNDIDEFLKLQESEVAIESFKEMIDTAKPQMTNEYKIFRDGKLHAWEIKNRHYGLRYEIDYYRDSQNGFKGTLLIYKHLQVAGKSVGDIDKLKVKGDPLIRLKTILSDKINAFYHDIRWVKNEPERSFEELIDVFHFSKVRTTIIKQLAWYLFHSKTKEFEIKTREIQSKIKSPTDRDLILKEVNGYENQEIDIFADYPTIQLAQSFFPKNRDGYVYFAKTIKDGETAKRVPCLISNKKVEIRLDFMKRKDSQSLLLIDNKYELPMEVETNIVDVRDLSLQYSWVSKWINDEIDDKDIHPATIIKEIEAFIRMTYYTTDDVAKVLSLWIYATYFYTLFQNGFPYLQFTGAKGTGKSTLDDIVNLLAFNPSFAVSISGAALYRQISMFGGTFILDEQENLTDSNKVNESDLAAVIKAGYANKGNVYRFSTDSGFSEKFSPFGPKVISNIMGVEDVIGDRCIVITTYSAPEEKLKNLIDTDVFKFERRDEVYSISSRAAISALVHFEDVNEVFQKNTRVDTGNARLTQILRPLVTMARVVGGDYEEHLMSFYKNEIQSIKDETALSTLEGKVKYILVSISEEILGLSKNKWILAHSHIYNKEPVVNTSTGQFELDSMHFKVYAEELSDNPNTFYTFKQIHAAVKNVMGKSWNYQEKKIKTRITIDDEGLLRQFNNKNYPHANRFLFNVREFISKYAEKIKYDGDKEEAESLF